MPSTTTASLPVERVDVRALGISEVAAAVRAQYEDRFGGKSDERGWLLKNDDWRRLSYVLGVLDTGGAVLDVGLGAGQFVNMLVLSGAFESVSGADHKRYDHYVELSPGIDHRIASVADLPFEDGQFDVVTCMEVLEHVPADVFVAGLGELRRVCKSRLIMTVPYKEPEPIYQHHLRRFVDADIRRCFPSGHFTLLDRSGTPWLLIEEMLGPPDPSLTAARLRRRVGDLETELAWMQQRRAVRLADWLRRETQRARRFLRK